MVWEAVIMTLLIILQGEKQAMGEASDEGYEGAVVGRCARAAAAAADW